MSPAWRAWVAQQRRLATTAELLLGRRPGTGDVSPKQLRALLDEVVTSGVVGERGAGNLQEASARFQQQLLRDGFDIGKVDGKLGASTVRVDAERRAERDGKPLPAAPRPIVPGQSRLLLIGDSYADGMHESMGRIAEANGVAFTPRFQRGSQAKAWATGALNETFVAALADTRPTHVAISLGTNDGLNGRTPAELRTSMDAIVRQIRTQSAEPVFLLSVPTSADHEGQIAPARRAILDYARAKGIGVVSAPRVEIEPDGVHPTALGYSIWAGRAWRGMTSR